VSREEFTLSGLQGGTPIAIDGTFTRIPGGTRVRGTMRWRSLDVFALLAMSAFLVGKAILVHVTAREKDGPVLAWCGGLLFVWASFLLSFRMESNRVFLRLRQTLRVSQRENGGAPAASEGTEADVPPSGPAGRRSDGLGPRHEPPWYQPADGMGYAFALLIAILVAFVLWRYTSVRRGALQRDRKILALLDPVPTRLAANEEPPDGAIESLARKPETAPLLFTMLQHFGRIELFPAELASAEAQGAAMLAYWMMHPNELQAPPEEIHALETVSRPLAGERLDYIVYRYRMPSGHGAGTDWLLGVAGAFREGGAPFDGIAAFSIASDKLGAVAPADLVDWYVGVTSSGR
jgi:hypothetical protein